MPHDYLGQEVVRVEKFSWLLLNKMLGRALLIPGYFVGEMAASGVADIVAKSVGVSNPRTKRQLESAVGRWMGDAIQDTAESISLFGTRYG